MSGGPCYLFSTPAQKATCLRTGLPETVLLDPATAQEEPSFAGARVLAAGEDGSLFAIDAQGRLVAGNGYGPWLGRAWRVVVGRTRIWALTRGALHQFDKRSLQHLLTLEAPDAIDIASDAGDGVWRLGFTHCERLRTSGRTSGAVIARRGATRIASAGGTLFLLDRRAGRIDLLPDGDPGRAVAIDLSRLIELAGGTEDEPECVFRRTDIAEAGGHILLCGTAAVRPTPRYLVLDPEGSVVGRGSGREGADARAAALAGDDLVLASADGSVKRYSGALAGGERWLTPPLEPGAIAESWIRAEVAVRLPAGATLSLAWAAVNDGGLSSTVEAVQTDPHSSAGDRFADAVGLLRAHWSPEFVYTGEAGDDGSRARALDFPIDVPAEATGASLWLYLKLRRNGAAAAPAIETLTVHHGRERLIDYLPAIYRGGGDADGTLRRLIGVLESTSHGVDREIGALAQRLDPRHCEQRWLPVLAETLGLPFDATLTPAMQRALVGAAGAILAGRGTRDGLAALFEALFPGRPVRVHDRVRDFLPVSLSGAKTAGTMLPALLGSGAARPLGESRGPVLGGTRLPGGGVGSAAGPQVVVSIPATGGERRRLAAALRQMGEAMVPAGVRVTLRWRPWRRGLAPTTPDALMLVDDPRPLELGDGTVGRAVLAGRALRMDTSAIGRAGHRLQ